MDEYYLSTDHMTVGYNGKALIRDIALQVRRGEILTLIGPNGSGKSTILKSLIQQLKLLGGTVYLDGRVMAKMSEKEISTRLSVLMTERIHPELMTCRDVVGTGRYPYTGRLGILSAEDRRIVRESLALVHGEALADRDFSAISDGQRQRILLARALCQEPEVIVLDEPTAYLDIRYKIELLDILREMAQQKQLTVILSLHEIDLAMKISDYLLCVKGETIASFGTPEEVLKNHVIEQLYGMEYGSYNLLFGSVELPKPEGEPKVFVIAGGGCGIPVYRALQKKGIPFATGILFENDVDFQVARALSSNVVSAPAFEEITDGQYQQAAKLLLQCQSVIDAGTPIGTRNLKNKQLLQLARDKKIPIYAAAMA